jgi:hypothetical protein
MPCDSIRQAGQTLAQRTAQIDVALKRLEASLLGGRVAVGIGPNGAIVLKGWADRDDITDVCAIRTLTAANSWALRQAIARAEATTGKKVNMQAVAAGVHSHDGGRSWYPGHK